MFDMCFLCKDIIIVSYCWVICMLVFFWDRVVCVMVIFFDLENVFFRVF